MENKLVPKLRFPGFEEEWEIKLLSNLSSKIGSGKTPLGGDKVYSNFGIPFIRSQNVTGDNLLLDQVHITHEVHNSMKSSKVLPNDILLNITGASIGRSCVVPHTIIEANVNQHVCIIRLKTDNAIFIQKILSSKIGQKLIYQTQTGSGREGLNFDSINKFKLNLPSLPEQQKIADYLSTIDKKITLLEEKKEELSRYKKAMMQKLFSQEIRFKDENGNDFPDWEEKRLEEMFFGLKGQGLSKDDISDTANNLCILYGELFTRYNEIIIDIASRTDLVGKVLSKKGDLLIPSSTTTTAIDLAKVSAILLDDIVLGGDINILRPRQNISSVFYAYYLSSYKRNQLGKLGQGITIVHLYYSHMKDMSIDVPSIKEQQKIADFLSAIDNSIDKVREQIEQTQAFKKAMLQQMFV